MMRLGSVGEKSMWPIQSVVWKRTLMVPAFAPFGPGFRRMVKNTTGVRDASRRSIIAPLSSDCTLAPPSVGFAAAGLAAAGFTAAGAPAAEAAGAACARVPPAPAPLPNPPAGAARNACGAFGLPPGQSAALYVPAPSVSSAFTLEMLTRGGRSISLVATPVLVSALYTALLRVTGSVRVKKTLLVLCPTTMARTPPPNPPRPPRAPCPACPPAAASVAGAGAAGAGTAWFGTSSRVVIVARSSTRMPSGELYTICLWSGVNAFTLK